MAEGMRWRESADRVGRELTLKEPDSGLEKAYRSSNGLAVLAGELGGVSVRALSQGARRS